jgi:hypothetical protein
MTKKILLGIGVALLLLGIFKPNLNFPIGGPSSNPTIVVVTPPQDKDLKDKCQLVVDILRDGPTDRKKDGARLSELYMDLATLIEMDGEDEVVKTTEEIRQANSLSGAMLRMNIKGKYPGLSDSAQAVITTQIGNDIVPLDDELRKKSAEAFRALAWACNEGSK